MSRCCHRRVSYFESVSRKTHRQPLLGAINNMNKDPALTPHVAANDPLFRSRSKLEQAATHMRHNSPF
jgi:hypothetical protein